MPARNSARIEPSRPPPIPPELDVTDAGAAGAEGHAGDCGGGSRAGEGATPCGGTTVGRWCPTATDTSIKLARQLSRWARSVSGWVVSWPIGGSNRGQSVSPRTPPSELRSAPATGGSGETPDVGPCGEATLVALQAVSGAIGGGVGSCLGIGPGSIAGGEARIGGAVAPDGVPPSRVLGTAVSPTSAGAAALGRDSRPTTIGGASAPMPGPLVAVPDVTITGMAATAAAPGGGAIGETVAAIVDAAVGAIVDVGFGRGVGEAVAAIVDAAVGAIVDVRFGRGVGEAVAAIVDAAVGVVACGFVGEAWVTAVGCAAIVACPAVGEMMGVTAGVGGDAAWTWATNSSAINAPTARNANAATGGMRLRSRQRSGPRNTGDDRDASGALPVIVALRSYLSDRFDPRPGAAQCAGASIAACAP